MMEKLIIIAAIVGMIILSSMALTQGIVSITYIVLVVVMSGLGGYLLGGMLK